MATVDLTERQLETLLRLCNRAMHRHQKQELKNAYQPEPGKANADAEASKRYYELIATLEAPLLTPRKVSP